MGRLATSKRKFISAIAFIVLACASTCWATVAVVVVTPTAIVAVVDTKTVTYPGKLSAPLAPGRAKKILLVRQHFAVADVGLERFTHPTPAGENVLFDFPTWISTIEHRLPGEISVTSLSEIIRDKSDRVFTHLGVGNFYDPRAEKNEATNVQRLADFLVIGYENGVPRVNLVEFKIDWKRRRLTQSTEVVHPVQGQRVDFGMYLFGRYGFVADAGNPQSQAHRRLADLVPHEYRAALSGEDLTPPQAIRLAGAFILVESEGEPTQVGFPVDAVTIPRVGNGRSVSYSKEALDLRPPH